MPRNRQNSPASPVRADTHVDNNLRLQRYDGTDSKVRAQSWMALFELDTSDQTVADRRKTLMYYLSGSALEWYADEIISTNVTDWVEIKTKFFNRFGITTSTPLIDAQRRYLRRDETVLQYYQDKLRLLRQTKLSEQDIVHQLTEGLPHDWKLTLTAANLTDTSNWIRIAQQVESHQQKQRQKLQRIPLQKRDTQPRSYAAVQNDSTRPPAPCRHCLQRGKTEWHWNRDCPFAQHQNHRNNNRYRPNNRNQRGLRQQPDPNAQPITESQEPMEETHHLN